MKWQISSNFITLLFLPVLYQLLPIFLSNSWQCNSEHAFRPISDSSTRSIYILVLILIPKLESNSFRFITDVLSPNQLNLPSYQLVQKIWIFSKKYLNLSVNVKKYNWSLSFDIVTSCEFCKVTFDITLKSYDILSIK